MEKTYTGTSEMSWGPELVLNWIDRLCSIKHLKKVLWLLVIFFGLVRFGSEETIRWMWLDTLVKQPEQQWLVGTAFWMSAIFLILIHIEMLYQYHGSYSFKTQQQEAAIKAKLEQERLIEIERQNNLNSQKNIMESLGPAEKDIIRRMYRNKERLTDLETNNSFVSFLRKQEIIEFSNPFSYKGYVNPHILSDWARKYINDNQIFLDVSN